MQATTATSTIQAITAAIGRSDYKAAHTLAEEALAKGEVHSLLYTARALWFERQNLDQDALADFETAASLDPQNVMLHNAIGLCLTRLYRLDEAVLTFDEAIRTNPSFAPSYRRKAIALETMGRLSAAKAEYLRALKLDPRDIESLGHLAMIEARSGRAAAARDLVQRALQTDPRNPTALIAQTLSALTGGDFAAAEAAARQVLSVDNINPGARAVAQGLLADALDGQNRAREAFAAYSAEKQILRAQHAPRFQHLRSATDHTRDIANSLLSLPMVPAHEESNEAGAAGHVFILGFYRSGTTLLRRVLEAHPQTVTLEEQDFLLRPAQKYLSDAGGLAMLATLSDEEAAAERAEYWQSIVDRGISVKGKVLIDKQPLNTIKLPLIAKLFPNAKIIFTVRDPRDVVLSSFRTHFEINAAMYELLTLEASAAFYASAMSLAQTMRPFVEDRLYLHRYEDLVADFDESMTRVCGFLGLPMVPELRDFQSLKDAQEISSQSGMQVTKKLHGESVGKWTQYREHLEPLMQELAPWTSYWGYPANDAVALDKVSN